MRSVGDRPCRPAKEVGSTLEQDGKTLKVKSESRSVVSDPMHLVHGILQARILEWVAFPFSRGSSQSSDQTQVSHIAGGFFTD